MYYLALARQPFGSADPAAHFAPYCWRIMGPLLVHLLPMPITVGFWLLTLSSLAGGTFALQWILRGLGLPRGAVIAGGCAWALLGPATGALIWSPFMTDPLALCLTFAMVGCAIHGRGRTLVLLAVLGALTKEATVLGAVFALLWSISRARHIRRASVMAIVGSLAMLFSLRLLIPNPAGPGGYSMLDAIKIIYAPPPWAPIALDILVLSWFVALRSLQATVGAWGFLFPVVLALPWARLRWRSTLPWAGLMFGALAQVAIATDVERRVIFATPAVLVAACVAIERFASQLGRSRWLFWVPTLLAQAYWGLAYEGWPDLPAPVPILLRLDAGHRGAAALILAGAMAILAFPRIRMLTTGGIAAAHGTSDLGPASSAQSDS